MAVQIICMRGEGPEGPRFHLVISENGEKLVDTYLTPEQYALSMTGVTISVPNEVETADLTEFRLKVLDKINGPGVSEEFPIRLQGAEFRAGLWLHEHNRIGKIGSKFFPLK